MDIYGFIWFMMILEKSLEKLLGMRTYLSNFLVKYR